MSNVHDVASRPSANSIVGRERTLGAEDLVMGSSMTESKLGYGLIDADNHYYEAEDAFLRHGDEHV
jgi:hypothetical protein